MEELLIAAEVDLRQGEERIFWEQKAWLKTIVGWEPASIINHTRTGSIWLQTKPGQQPASIKQSLNILGLD